MASVYPYPEKPEENPPIPPNPDEGLTTPPEGEGTNLPESKQEPAPTEGVSLEEREMVSEGSPWVYESGAVAPAASTGEPDAVDEEAPSASQAPETPPLQTESGAGGTQPPHPEAEPLSPEDERTWAMLAHLSVLVNLVTGILGPLAALIIYLVYRDRSRFVAFHAMQSFVFQLVWWVGGVALITIMWVVTGLLSAIIIGLLCIPFAVLGTVVLLAMPLVALIYGVIGAIEVSQGRPFKYWLIGDWVRDSLNIT